MKGQTVLNERCKIYLIVHNQGLFHLVLVHLADFLHILLMLNVSGAIPFCRVSRPLWVGSTNLGMFRALSSVAVGAPGSSLYQSWSPVLCELLTVVELKRFCHIFLRPQVVKEHTLRHWLCACWLHWLHCFARSVSPH